MSLFLVTDRELLKSGKNHINVVSQLAFLDNALFPLLKNVLECPMSDSFPNEKVIVFLGDDAASRQLLRTFFLAKGQKIPDYEEGDFEWDLNTVIYYLLTVYRTFTTGITPADWLILQTTLSSIRAHMLEDKELSIEEEERAVIDQYIHCDVESGDEWKCIHAAECLEQLMQAMLIIADVRINDCKFELRSTKKRALKPNEYDQVTQEEALEEEREKEEEEEHAAKRIKTVDSNSNSVL